ncbi:MAG TPA: serpin family protein [Polyangiaceae bacterium]|nr:serpin family protein [Polyangiaceae bacterium]
MSRHLPSFVRPALFMSATSPPARGRHRPSFAPPGLTFRFALAAGLAVGGLACTAESLPPEAPSPTFDVARSSLARDTSPNATPAELVALAEGNAAFAMKLYGLTAAKGEGNAFFSPLSISTALAMAYAGARGDTAKEMEKALEHRLPGARHHVAMNALDLQIAARGRVASAAGAPPSGKPFALRSVNSTFGQRGVAFEAPFLDTLATSYGAGVQLADFKNKPNEERLKINEWVAQQTERRIEDLLAEGTINAITRLVLVNAIYFNADWATPFEKEATAPATFTKLGGAQAQVPTMRGELSTGYAEIDGAQVLELRYMGGQVSMVVVLPKGDFRTFESSFDGKGLLSAMAGLTPHTVRVSLPKFELKGQSVSLRESLLALGMTRAFDERTADFSGMLSPDVDKLWISDVLHKAFVRVDEKGTEAAAATAVVLAGTTSVPADVKTFRADRPFLFFVRDIPTNTAIFAGRMVAP